MLACWFACAAMMKCTYHCGYLNNINRKEGSPNDLLEQFEYYKF